MKVNFNLFILSALSSVASSCPFSKTSSDIPDDNQHRHLRRRMASLREGETKDKLASIIKKQQLKADERKRSLQTSCMTNEDYNDIRVNIAQMAAAVSALLHYSLLSRDRHYCSVEITIEDAPPQ